MPRRRRLPSYRLHKPSGQAVVTLSGRDHYLGAHGSEISRVLYDRLVAEWLANGRRLPSGLEEPEGVLSVAEVCRRFLEHAEGYYVKHGKPSPEQYHIRGALKVVQRLYGSVPVTEFGPLALKACREVLVRRGQCRKTVNQNVSRIKRMVRWATENEMVPSSVYHGLQSVPGLRRGRTEARESEPVKPVSEADIEAVLPFVSREVRAMIRLQLLTGMRPGEVVILRGVDLDRSSDPWRYRPHRHKTEHHGHERVVYLGPKAQAILRPFLEDGYLFSPRRAEEARNGGRRINARALRRRKPDRPRAWREHYDTASYRRAIHRACQKAGVPPWSPHRLRHTAATRLRREFGIEAARVILGHRSAAVTEIYAEMDRSEARRVMARVG